ncbi:MAG TPA: Hpt domain-containing protein, partial [Verrucomicrobiae bacterium]|nr:Hpt domain-containing protein [Verrucomicrobiae bacterium]
MTFPSDEQTSELHDLFFESAAEILQGMNDAGLALEERPGDAEQLRHVRRAVHTLKGDSAACGYRQLSELAHDLEDVLTPELAQQNAGLTAEVILTAADTFHEMLAAYRSKLQPPAGGALREHIRKLLNKPEAETQDSSFEAKFDWTEYERLMIAEAFGRSEAVYNIALQLDPEALLPAAALELVRKGLEGAGRILAFRPDMNAPIDELRLIQAALSSAKSPDWIRQRCHIPSIVKKISIDAV